MKHTVAYIVWLFLPGIATIWAGASIWRTTRLLTHVDLDTHVSRGRLLTSLVERTGPKPSRQGPHLSR